MRILLFTLLILACALSADAQSIRLQVTDAPLRDALMTVRAESGSDVVFSERLVEGMFSTCTYFGDDVREALTCVLRDTGLTAKRVRRKQFVVVGSSRASEDPADNDRRYTLSGFVRDAETDEVLPGAHIYLPDLQAGTTTNEAGYFALPALPKGAYRLHVSFLGYVSQTRDVDAGSSTEMIELQPTTLEGGAIVIEGEGRDGAGRSSVPGLLSEPVSRLESMPTFFGESDLLHALQWFPGIRKSGEINGGMIIRGAPPDQNLYLLDGAPVYHPWHAFSLISTFQTETFKDVKLYRGSFPSEYGGRISAVLDAQMKDGSRRQPQALIALSPISGRFIVETPATRNSSFMVAGRRSYVDKLIGREHPVEDESGLRDTLRTGYYFYDASAKFTQRFGRGDRLSIAYYHGGDDLDLRLPFDLSLDFSSWLRPTELFFEVAHRWENQLVSGRYQRLVSDRMFATVTAYSSSYSAREGALLRPTTTAEMQSDYHVDLHDVGVKVDVEYAHSLAHQLQVGTQVVMRSFESGLDARIKRSPGAVDNILEASDSRESEVAIYAQDTWQPNDRWTVRPGLRYTMFGNGLHTGLSPGVSFEYVVDDEYFHLRAGASRNVQYLHRLRDRYAFTYDLVTSRWIPASKDVNPSSSVQVSGGFESRPFDGVSVTGEVFWRDVDDVLVPEDAFRAKDDLVGPGIAVGELLGQYVEGDARAFGVEVSADIVRAPWVIRVSYSGGRSLTRSSALGETTFRSARYDVPRAVRAYVSRSLKNWRVNAALDLRSGYPTSVPVAQYVVGDPLDGDGRYLHRPHVNNGRLPAYLRVDVSASRSFEMLSAEWTAQIHVYNITNRRNVIARQYVPDADGVEVQDRRGLPVLPLFEIEMQL